VTNTFLFLLSAFDSLTYLQSEIKRFEVFYGSNVIAVECPETVGVCHVLLVLCEKVMHVCHIACVSVVTYAFK